MRLVIGDPYVLPIECELRRTLTNAISTQDRPIAGVDSHDVVGTGVCDPDEMSVKQQSVGGFSNFVGSENRAVSRSQLCDSVVFGMAHPDILAIERDTGRRTADRVGAEHNSIRCLNLSNKT